MSCTETCIILHGFAQCGVCRLALLYTKVYSVLCTKTFPYSVLRQVQCHVLRLISHYTVFHTETRPSSTYICSSDLIGKQKIFFLQLFCTSPTSCMHCLRPCGVHNNLPVHDAQEFEVLLTNMTLSRTLHILHVLLSSPHPLLLFPPYPRLPLPSCCPAAQPMAPISKY